MLRIEMLAAGHGDALVVEYGPSTKDARRLLVDAGTIHSWDAVRARLAAMPHKPYEAFVITHVDLEPRHDDPSLGEQPPRSTLQLGGRRHVVPVELSQESPHRSGPTTSPPSEREEHPLELPDGHQAPVQQVVDVAFEPGEGHDPCEIEGSAGRRRDRDRVVDHAVAGRQIKGDVDYRPLRALERAEGTSELGSRPAVAGNLPDLSPGSMRCHAALTAAPDLEQQPLEGRPRCRSDAIRTWPRAFAPPARDEPAQARVGHPEAECLPSGERSMLPRGLLSKATGLTFHASDRFPEEPRSTRSYRTAAPLNRGTRTFYEIRSMERIS